MNRKDRRAAKVKLARPALQDLSKALCLAAPWCIRKWWGDDLTQSAVMSFAAREVLRRHQYGGEPANAVLLIGNPQATLCVGDKRAGYDLVVRRSAGRAPSFEEWESATIFSGDAEGRHTVLHSYENTQQSFLDLTFGQVASATKGAIAAPPCFVAFGPINWHAATFGDVWLQYAPAPGPSPPAVDLENWRGLIEDLAMLVGVALGVQNNEQAFDEEMSNLLRGR